MPHSLRRAGGKIVRIMASGVTSLLRQLPDGTFQVAAQLLGKGEYFDFLSLFGRVSVG